MYNNKQGPVLAVFKAPDDPEQHKEWVRHVVRLQVAMWVDDGAKCAWCGLVYTTVDDLLERKPKRGLRSDQFVDASCWDAYDWFHTSLKREQNEKL